MNKIQTIKDVYLLAYYNTKSGKIGSMRFVEAKDDKAIEMLNFMKRELITHKVQIKEKLNHMYNEQPQNIEAHRELEDLITYYDELDVIVIKDGKSKKGDKSFKMEGYAHA